MVTSAALSLYRSPQLMIAPLDTTVHLHKVPPPEHEPHSWTLNTAVVPEPTGSPSPPITTSSSEAVVPVPPYKRPSVGRSDGDTYEDREYSQPCIPRMTSTCKTRVCSKCKESKPFPAAFHRAGLNRSGVVTYRPDCADCHRALDRIAKRLKRAAHRPKQSLDIQNQPKVVSLTDRLDAETDNA